MKKLVTKRNTKSKKPKTRKHTRKHKLRIDPNPYNTTPENNNIYFMECGHIANGVTPNGTRVCVSCYGATPKATRVAMVVPSIAGRIARCTYCKRETPSKYTLAFFTPRPTEEFDTYYCGCRGWN